MQTNNNRIDFSQLFEGEEIPEVSAEDKKQLDAIGENARACLNTSAFDKYRKHYEAMMPKLLDIMVNYTVKFRTSEISLEQYAVNMACYITKISDLRALLLTVEMESRKKNEPTSEDSVA